MIIDKARMEEFAKELDNIFSQYSSEDIEKLTNYLSSEIEKRKKSIEARKNSDEYKRLKESEK